MRNGSGTYQAPSGSWNPATNGNSATAADWNTLLADIASALTQSVSADGQTPITGNLNMGNNKLTSLAAGSASGQSVAWQQLFSQGTESDIASASTVDIGAQNTNFLRVTGTTTITSFGTNYNGPRFLRFAGILTLTHNASTLILPTGANITTAAGDCCIALPISGGWYVAAYQRASGQALAAATVPDASETVKGIVELATTTEAQAGTDTSRAVTAAGVLSVARQVQHISASVGSNTLTISASALSLDFRSTTAGSGTVTRVSGTPANLVISSSSTLGTVSAVQSDIAVLAINNAGTIELAAVNLSGGVALDESGLISTTAEGGAGGADSATVIYSTTARSNVAYRVLGIIRSTQATAGTWATAPSLIQGAGGEAVESMGSVGFGQTWQGVTRNSGTTYYNTTGKPIMLHVRWTSGSANSICQVTVNGVALGDSYATVGISNTMQIMIPAGASYVVTTSGSGVSHSSWELR